MLGTRRGKESYEIHTKNSSSARHANRSIRACPAALDCNPSGGGSVCGRACSDSSPPCAAPAEVMHAHCKACGKCLTDRKECECRRNKPVDRSIKWLVWKSHPRAVKMRP